MKKIIYVLITSLIIISLSGCSSKSKSEKEEDTESSNDYTYPIVDTSLGICYNNSEIIEGPAEGEAFYGQDAQYTGNVPFYKDNEDGTVTDNVTGLIWTQNLSEKSMTWEEAGEYCENLEFAGYDDWRLPSLKELWSIRNFSVGWPWVDTDYFYLVGDGSEVAQQHTWSSNAYLVDTEEAVDNVAFAVNDWTGHIKSFIGSRFVRAVRGDAYGINDFEDNGDGTITDEATGLMWSQDDSREGMDWETALAYAENYDYAGYDDWRLPNIKELQSIVDYSGIFPAIDPIFNITGITNEAGNSDYPYFWSSTTNSYIDPEDKDNDDDYCYAWYVAFGYAVDSAGNDIHGAGAVRFDTKVEGGTDGMDGERYYNYVRLVRGGDVIKTPEGDTTTVVSDRVVPIEDGDTSMSANGTGETQNVIGGSKQGGTGETQNVAGSSEQWSTDGPPTGTSGSEQGSTDGPPTGTSDSEQGSTDGPPTGTSGSEQGSTGGPPTGTNGSEQGSKGGPPTGTGEQQKPDFSAAAEQLGVTEEALIDALGDPNGGKPDFATAAATLGITEAELQDALGVTTGE
jgi:hypothetical protein